MTYRHNEATNIKTTKNSAKMTYAIIAIVVTAGLFAHITFLGPSEGAEGYENIDRNNHSTNNQSVAKIPSLAAKPEKPLKVVKTKDNAPTSAESLGASSEEAAMNSPSSKPDPQLQGSTNESPEKEKRSKKLHRSKAKHSHKKTKCLLVFFVCYN